MTRCLVLRKFLRNLNKDFPVFMAAMLTAATFAAGCSGESAKSRYILAERLWTDGRYAAAVNEFEKVVVKDPKGKLGLQALFRAAMTEMLYLNQYDEAIRKFRMYVDANTDVETGWEAQKQIGEILFSKTDRYEQAIEHYRGMLRSSPNNPNAPEFMFRIAKSRFYLWQFQDAVSDYREIVKKYPGSKWAEKAAFEIGVTYFTRGAQSPVGRGAGAEVYQDAMDAYEDFLNKYPNSRLAPEARFGVASCLEEMDQLDAAIHHFEALWSSFPSLKVIEIKLARIAERKKQRSR